MCCDFDDYRNTSLTNLKNQNVAGIDLVSGGVVRKPIRYLSAKFVSRGFKTCSVVVVFFLVRRELTSV